MKAITLLLLVLSAALSGVAQTPSKDAMKKLSAWTGHWIGPATWSMRGAPEHSTADERIEWKADGHALLINGLGKDKDGKIVHEALGVLSYNANESKYKLNTWLRDGRSTDAWFNIIAENQFQWGFDTPQGKIRYTIVLTEKTWKETGEFSSDDKQWYPFFEMNLNKQSDK